MEAGNGGHVAFFVIDDVKNSRHFVPAEESPLSRADTKMIVQ